MRADTAAQYGAAAGTPVSTAMPTNQARPTPNASTSIPPAPPVQNCDPREECATTPKQHAVLAPNHNLAPMDKWASSDCAKENAPGDANGARQLEDARLRIENAKKFIMSRNTRRATPSSQIARPPINNMTPGAKAIPFRPHSMTTPGSQAGNVQPLRSVTPGTQASPSMPQMKMMSGPGSQANIFRPPVNTGTPVPQTYQNLGSLMSQESETSGASPEIEPTTTPGTQRANDDQKFMSTPGTQNSGYRTPQMPGKYFFA